MWLNLHSLQYRMSRASEAAHFTSAVIRVDGSSWETATSASRSSAELQSEAESSSDSAKLGLVPRGEESDVSAGQSEAAEAGQVAEEDLEESRQARASVHSCR